MVLHFVIRYMNIFFKKIIIFLKFILSYLLWLSCENFSPKMHSKMFSICK